MAYSNSTIPSFEKPDYGYGNHSPLEVIRLRPVIGGAALDPHASLEYDVNLESPFTEAELQEKVSEIAANYTIIGDPDSTESHPKQFGFTVANAHRMQEGVPGILVLTTHASSLYDEDLNPNNEGNALELAYTAFHYPDRPIYLVESPGTGNSTDFEQDEYRSAARDGRLITVHTGSDGKIIDYEAFPTLQALQRSLHAANILISHISSNTTGAHISSALAVAQDPGTIERTFLYGTSNISDRTALGLIAGNLWEVATQGRYKSHDPLELTEERKEMAKRTMSDRPKRKIDQARAQTHNPVKLWRQNQIWRRGDRHGQAAAVHAVAGQMRHPEVLQTYVLPQFAAFYKRPEDFEKFMRAITHLGSHAIEMTDIESLLTPLGQYGHTHFPSVRQTFESYAFNRR
ncbi:MAG: hypothetical protein ACHQT9_00800 [Candidatus Saccharimonadales bacterium]